ncbi:MAG: ABC transporter permease [Algiphilus sp.]|uniref:ABC transporter permease n=1 Tax=Algiphilus sp. TaxID=1872431 RepID=UPI0025C07B06|nr:ABC transporter permease [Algiphilus sp.]MCI5102824.1 ABC transporter permease [Algiphilus sp.]
MTLLALAWANLLRDKLAAALNTALMAIGIATIVLLLLFGHHLEERMRGDAAGIDLVIGAKGSPSQLVLSAIYHADIPTGNIPLAEAQRWAEHPMVRTAIPQALGDSWRGFRIVGTTTAYPALYAAGVREGRLWQAPGEATIGAAVAASGLAVDDSFSGVHGFSPEGHVHGDSRYRVVGVLAPTGTVIDRLILTSVESVWAVHGTAEPTDPEITTLLIDYATPFAATTLPRLVNSQSQLQAAAPAVQTNRMLQLLGVGIDGVRAFAWLLVVSAGLGVFIALYHALEARRYELALLRCLGATRGEVLISLVIEGVLLSLAGTLLGVFVGHLVAELAGQWLGFAATEGLTGWQWLPAESWLLLYGTAIGALAALVPAIRAYRRDVTAVLKSA